MTDCNNSVLQFVIQTRCIRVIYRCQDTYVYRWSSRLTVQLRTICSDCCKSNTYYPIMYIIRCLSNYPDRGLVAEPKETIGYIIACSTNKAQKRNNRNTFEHINANIIYVGIAENFKILLHTLLISQPKSVIIMVRKNLSLFWDIVVL